MKIVRNKVKYQNQEIIKKCATRKILVMRFNYSIKKMKSF